MVQLLEVMRYKKKTLFKRGSLFGFQAFSSLNLWRKLFKTSYLFRKKEEVSIVEKNTMLYCLVVAMWRLLPVRCWPLATGCLLLKLASVC